MAKSNRKRNTRGRRNNADGRVADAPPSDASLDYNLEQAGDPTDGDNWMFEPTKVTMGFNSRYLPSIGKSLTDAELNERPLPERVVQLLVDALYHFYVLNTSPNSLRASAQSEHAAASIYGILRGRGIEVDMF